MRIIRPEQFLTQPWKNGGGITHEIARADRDGTLLWRLSIAEVASDGPFSAFPGLTRILTVIEGAGLHLHTRDGTLNALPMQPVRFSGDTPIDSRRIDGMVRDFNLIWDANRLAASVTPVSGRLPACPAAQGRHYAFLSLEGAEPIGLPDGSLAFFEQFESSSAVNISGLLVQFEPIP